jgi:hypothetical protein
MNMTPEQQRIAIAEFCGWKDCHLSASWASIIGTLYEVNGNQYAMIPDYLNDLNAMHEAERVLNPSLAAGYARMLTSIAWESEQPVFAPMTATAAQRAEAFLRTIGKWEVSND